MYLGPLTIAGRAPDAPRPAAASHPRQRAATPETAPKRGNPAGCRRGHVVRGGERARGGRSPQKGGAESAARRALSRRGGAVGAGRAGRGRRVSGRRRRSGRDSRYGRTRARTLVRGGGRAPCADGASAKLAPRRAALLTAAAHPRPRCPPMQAHNRRDGRMPPGCRHARSTQGWPRPWPVAGAMPRRSMTWQPGTAPPLLPTLPTPHPPLAHKRQTIPVSPPPRQSVEDAHLLVCRRLGDAARAQPYCWARPLVPTGRW